MLYMVNSNASLRQCLDLVQKSDVVVVFADTCIDVSLLETLSGTTKNIKIVDGKRNCCQSKTDTAACSFNKTQSMDLYKVEAQDAALFIGSYEGRVVSLL